MTSAAFGMDNDIPDWTEDFDFGAFLNFPPDNADQGDMFGLVFFYWLTRGREKQRAGPAGESAILHCPTYDVGGTFGDHLDSASVTCLANCGTATPFRPCWLP